MKTVQLYQHVTGDAARTASNASCCPFTNRRAFSWRVSEVLFIQTAPKPELLLLSDTHGVERGVVDIVQSCVQRNAQRLPGLILVPEVSPSAVRLGSRINGAGNDLNRCFEESASDDEAQAVMNLVRDRVFTTSVNFHENPANANAFYLYEIGGGEASSDGTWWPTLREEIERIGVEMFSGVDDPSDQALGFLVEDGRAWINVDGPAIASLFETWTYRAEVVRGRMVIVEVPGRADAGIKSPIVECVLRHLAPVETTTVRGGTP